MSKVLSASQESTTVRDGRGALPTPTKTFTFRLTEGKDPEERLEEAALWKAMHDVYGDAIEPVTEGEADYGRPRRFVPGSNQPARLAGDIAYWTDPAFIKHAGRRFWVGQWEDADEQVRALHADGLGAFIKSTRAKHWIAEVPVGQSLDGVASDMAYSYIDGGPAIMVQERAKVSHEHRFFVIDRRIVTSSPNAAHLTPLDYPQIYDFETPRDHKPSLFSARGFLLSVAEDIARHMATPDAVIDCAIINGEAACVELNPMIVGGVGLFACNVRALAGALHERDVGGSPVGEAAVPRPHTDDCGRPDRHQDLLAEITRLRTLLSLQSEKLPTPKPRAQTLPSVGDWRDYPEAP